MHLIALRSLGKEHRLHVDIVALKSNSDLVASITETIYSTASCK
jgi:hypothetical protein